MAKKKDFRKAIKSTGKKGKKLKRVRQMISQKN